MSFCLSSGAGERDVELIVVDPSRARRIRRALICRGSRAADGGVREPAFYVEAVGRRWGVAVAALRWSLDTTGRYWQLELERLPSNGRDPREWSWRDWTPEPLAERAEWERPGWFLRIGATLEGALAGCGLRRTGTPLQARHSPLGAVLRVPTDRGWMWFKHVLPPFAHEAQVVTGLRRLRPRVLPEVVACGPAWSLCTAFPPEQEQPTTDPYLELAGLQIAAVEATGDLSARGCPRRDLRRLSDDFALLAARTDLLSESRRVAVADALPGLARLCAEAGSLGFPETIVHGDFHAGNRRWTGDAWLLYDWTDSLISNPLLDLALAYRFEPPARVASGRAAFAARWSTVLPATNVRRGVELSQTLGAAHQALNYARIGAALGAHHAAWATTQIEAWTSRLALAAAG